MDDFLSEFGDVSTTPTGLAKLDSPQEVDFAEFGEVDLSEFGEAAPQNSQYQDVSTPSPYMVPSRREDLISRWKSTYSSMADGPERERYGKLLAKAVDAHTTMNRFNDPLLFRAGETAAVRTGVGIMTGGLAAGEILLDLPGADYIPGAESARASLQKVRDGMQDRAAKFEAKEAEFDKESAIGKTAAGLTRDFSGLIGQLAAAYAMGGTKVAGRDPFFRAPVRGGEIALGAMLGAESAAHSLHKNPEDPKTALLHGALNGGGAVFLGKSGDVAKQFGAKITPRAAAAVSNKYSLTPIFDTLAHSAGGGAELAATSALDYMMDVALTGEEFDSDELVSRVGAGLKTGAVLGGAMRVAPAIGEFKAGKLDKAMKELAETMKKRKEAMPTAAQAIAAAREAYKKGLDIEAGIKAKFGEKVELPPEFKEYFDGEYNALIDMESQYKQRVRSINTEFAQVTKRRAETKAMLDELNAMDAELRGDVDATINRAVGKPKTPFEESRGAAYSQGGILVEGSEAAMKDFGSMRETLLAELDNLNTRELDLNLQRWKMDREGKTVKEFVESEMDRISSDENIFEETALRERFSKSLDDAVKLEDEIAKSRRVKTGTDADAAPATDKELVDSLGDFTISGRQRDVNRMRKFFDMDAMTPEESLGFENVMMNAQSKGLIDRASATADDVLKTGRLMNSEEFIGVVERSRLNKNQYTELVKDWGKAKTKEDAQAIGLAMKAIEDEQDLLTTAAHRNNSDVARRFNISKMALESAFDPLALISKGQRARGDDLTPAQTEFLRRLGTRIERAQKIKDKYGPDSRRYKIADYKQHQMQTDAINFINNLKPKTFAGKLYKEVLGFQDIMKAMQLSADVSFATLQGGITLTTRPKTVAKAMGTFVHTLKDPVNAVAENRFLMNRRKNSDLYRKYDIGVRELGTPLTSGEYVFMSDWSQRLPIVGRFEGAYQAALNRLRAELFDSLVRSRGGRTDLNDTQLKTLAQYVRYATGRGDLRGFESVARELSAIFLSPRWFVSRFQYASGAPFWRAMMNKDLGTMRLIGQEYAKFIGFSALAGHIAAGMASAVFPGKVSYTSNPLNPNVGILNVNGVNYDMTAGVRRPVRLVVAMAKGLVGAEKFDYPQALGMLFQGAHGPYGRYVAEATTHKELGSSNPIDFSDPSQLAWFAAKGFIPLPVQALVRGLADEGVSLKVAQETAGAIMGVPTWRQKQKRRTG